MQIAAKLRVLKTSMLIIIVLIAILLLELFASHLIPPSDNFYIWPPGLEKTFTPDQEILPGTSPRVWFRTNSYGLRSYNPAPNDDYRALVLGGSAAECLYLDERATWPRLILSNLQQEQPRLQAWVGNGGRSGMNSRDHICHLKYLPLRSPLDVDAVIILLGVNDLLLRLRQGDTFDPLYLKQPGAETRQLDHAFLFVPYQFSLPPPPLYKRTGLWRVAKRIGRRFFSERPQDARGEMVALWRENRRSSAIRIDRLPDLGPALREYLSNIQELIDLASIKDVRLIFVTQPALWKKDPSPEEENRLWMGGVGPFKTSRGQPYYTARALADGLERYNQFLVSFCRWRGVECIDLAAGFPRTTDVFYDDCHFTVQGSELAAREISRYLSQHPPWKQ
ncbi:MAG: SGNH/GDSL hydrolase family protein, partial [PVC group bacterium]